MRPSHQDNAFKFVSNETPTSKPWRITLQGPLHTKKHCTICVADGGHPGLELVAVELRDIISMKLCDLIVDL